jgi:hypothetical protein
MLIRNNTLIVEGPSTSGGNKGGKEAVLRIFYSHQDCVRYRDVDKTNATVTKTTIMELWDSLQKINTMSMDSYKVPIRVEVSSFEEGKMVTKQTLRSACDPMN